MTHHLESKHQREVFDLLAALESINEQLGRLALELLFTLGDGITLKPDVAISHQSDAIIVSLAHVYEYDVESGWTTQDIIRITASLSVRPSLCDARVAVEYHLASVRNSLPARSGILREQHCQKASVEDALIFLRKVVDDLWDEENLLAAFIR
ncbi:hypothetical protein [Streptomyces monomycini]|nr:hypothetical protein [Streptomyces monomycini]